MACLGISCLPGRHFPNWPLDPAGIAGHPVPEQSRRDPSLTEAVTFRDRPHRGTRAQSRRSGRFTVALRQRDLTTHKTVIGALTGALQGLWAC
jgi:hypothetical protein